MAARHARAATRCDGGWRAQRGERLAAGLRLCLVCSVPWYGSRKMCCKKDLIMASRKVTKKQSALRMESASMAAVTLPGGDNL